MSTKKKKKGKKRINNQFEKKNKFGFGK